MINESSPYLNPTAIKIHNHKKFKNTPIYIYSKSVYVNDWLATATPVCVKGNIFSSISFEKKLEIKQYSCITPKLNIVQVTKGKGKDFKKEFKETLWKDFLAM